MYAKFALIVIFALSIITISSAAAPNEAKELIGLWEAKRIFGPDVSGALTLTKQGSGWRANIAGLTANANLEQGKIHFAIPRDRGQFTGVLKNNIISGHWIQPPGFSYASPLELRPVAKNRWRGEVVPLKDQLTLYMPITQKSDGSIGAFIRNPERNIGIFMNIHRLERHGEAIKLIGSFFQNKDESVLANGTYHAGEGRLSIYIPNRGGTFDFERVDDDPLNGFYARGKNRVPYRYSPPPAEDDGWPVGTLDEAKIALEPVQKLIETVFEKPPDSIHSPDVHAMLIARHGKLVLEEYFHGFHRNEAHDTRSASKSLTSTLVGAAILSGAPLRTSSPVYEVIYRKNLASNIDPRKKRMTVEHLLTMSSGFNCDDSDPASPGNEDVMQQQTKDPDWYHYTLNLGMIREPGEKSVYCSINPNLLGDVLSSATGKSLTELLHTLIANPLQIKNYYLNLMPTGQPYMGGGIRWMPRDFMKLAQLLVNKGTWNGHRVVSKEWVERSISPLVEIRGKKYGYLWWLIDYPYHGRTVRAFYAGGNGGQVIMGIPELDLVLAFYGGNYNDPPVIFKIQEEYVPQYILPAVKE